jgi:hypothetical protein
MRSALAASLAVIAALAGSSVLAGCTMEPRYRRPHADLASDWPDAAAPALSAASDIGWREFFADARLQKLIEIALVHNLAEYRSSKGPIPNSKGLAVSGHLFERH